ncbi:MAG TPA: signal peptidase II [Eubacterium sp.]|nr:signal peptidase II [Eubacterium sp.]
MKNKITYVLFVVAVTAMILLDQYTKVLAKSKLENKASFYILKDIFCFEYVTNKGAAWGMMQNRISLFLIFTIAVLVFIIYAYIKCPKTRYYMAFRICLMLIFAGAIGNMIDRAFRGYVIDFIYVECINFPVFNVADCYITIATAVLFILFLFVYKQEDDFDFLKIKHG